jgi:CheY-like chemotaxis protein
MKYRNILLVDDDNDDHEIFAAALNEMKSAIKFQGINNAIAALDMLIKNEIVPDAIFLDLNMPVMNGLNFLELVKKKEKLKNIPVIVYSTSSNSLARNSAKLLGAYDFITKPDKFEDLVLILKRILN